MKMIDSVNIIQPREAKGTKEGRNKGKPDYLNKTQGSIRYIAHPSLSAVNVSM